jgi:hypothetical protein
VHEPPPKRRGPPRGPEEFVLVRDGFYFWAFLLAPLWLLYRRLWLVLLGYILLMVAVGFGLRWIGVTDAGSFLIHLLLSALIGLEAGTLWRWTLRRRGWRELGAVSASDIEAAERRFFDSWTGEASTLQSAHGIPSPTYPAYPMHPTGLPARENGVVGLFPEPGAPR